MAATHLHFSLDSEGFSDRLRALWWEDDNPVAVLKMLLDGGMLLEEAYRFLDGKLTINSACQVVESNVEPLPNVTVTLQRLNELYVKQYLEYQETFLRLANPKRSGLTGSTSEPGCMGVAKISLETKKYLTPRLSALTSTFVAMQKLSELTGVSNPVTPVPLETPDFLRFYANDIQLANERSKSFWQEASYYGNMMAEHEEFLKKNPDKRINMSPKKEKIEKGPYGESKMDVSPRAALSRDENGYFDREGIFYPCGFEEHRYFAYWVWKAVFPKTKIPGNPQRELDNIGWVKMSKQRIMFTEINEAYEHQAMTPAQVEAVTNWADAAGLTEFEFKGMMRTIPEFLERAMQDHAAPIKLTVPSGIHPRGHRPSKS